MTSMSAVSVLSSLPLKFGVLTNGFEHQKNNEQSKIVNENSKNVKDESMKNMCDNSKKGSANVFSSSNAVIRCSQKNSADRVVAPVHQLVGKPLSRMNIEVVDSVKFLFLFLLVVLPGVIHYHVHS